MKNVYKFSLSFDSDYQTIKVPKGTQFLSFINQHNIPVVYGLCSPNEEMEERFMRITGTGHPIDFSTADFVFIGTEKWNNGALIFHLFEVIKKK